MSVPLSLLIYNPIEAYILILLCDVIAENDTKFTIKRALLLWDFGATNLFIQLVPYIWYGKWFFAIFNVSVNYIIIPFSIMYYYRIVSCRIGYFRCFISELINCLFIIIISNIFDLLIDKYDMFFSRSISHEFISNMTIFFVQIILYSIIKHRRFLYEKHFQNFRK